MVIPSIEALKLFATDFVRQHPNGATVGLVGELGAGKTTFVRCCVEALAKASHKPTPKVTSPTFVFHQRYELTPSVEHFDLYRFEKASDQELTEIGYFDALERANSEGFVFVEWPEKAANRDTLQLTKTLQFSVDSPTTRTIQMDGSVTCREPQDVEEIIDIQ